MTQGSISKVHLVGAGPGDPELLTVKAQRLIRHADVILHDDLVPAVILALAGPQADVVNVGKRCGRKGITQEEIHARMIEAARRSMDVVRLKSGDPGIFGRLGEEIKALETAGVPFEVVPGVTAGIAAAAALGASLTNRRKASRVIIVSGHPVSKDGLLEKPDWKGLVRDDATLVVYLPGNRFASLREELLTAGLDPSIPAVIVSRATTPQQQQRLAPLGALHGLPPMESPAVLLIGWAFEGAHRKLSPEDCALVLEEADLAVSRR
jgi:uroporphyrin-III C-methyltransferase